MKLIKVDSCTNCPLCSYYPTDYYRNAYFKCTKSGFDVTGNYYSGTIYERCQLENEPNSSNTVLCEPVSASVSGAYVGGGAVGQNVRVGPCECDLLNPNEKCKGLVNCKHYYPSA